MHNYINNLNSGEINFIKEDNAENIQSEPAEAAQDAWWHTFNGSSWVTP